MAGGKRLLKPEKPKLWKRILTGVLIVLALCTVCYGAWKIFVPAPEMAQLPVEEMPAEELPVEETAEPEQTAEEAQPEEETAQEAEEEEPEEEPEPEVNLYERRQNVWNFLLAGVDAIGANTDSILVVQYDVDHQVVNVASIARDTRVDISNRSIKKINAAYAAGGMEELRKEVSLMLGIPIDYYIKVSTRGFINLIHAVGGIDFYVPCSMNYDDPDQNLSIHYRKGQQHLSGRQALEVCRFRQNNNSAGYGDEGRMSTQRAVLTAVAKKILSWGNITRVNEFAEIMAKTVDTDLSGSNILWFAGKAVSFDTENLNTMALPVAWHSPYMYLDPAETLTMVNQYLNPYTIDRTADMLDIVTR